MRGRANFVYSGINEEVGGGDFSDNFGCVVSGVGVGRGKWSAGGKGVFGGRERVNDPE
ncbi:MAG: hypothetical protein UX82_C0002G0034 [Microgenomates group bacterium GW2011_GWE1_47_12]|nr:MAG: hypothetical protein UX32_C0002G0025 [Microgenomates group bacterium GW2011_GWF1_46_12]KKU27989.1 MAG: hypothetical protein UX40_C0004G0019 [Microgenomates group bacterium GW2011_GWF2_46_18]KKU45663.1 MAG: hypothetical protein UX63_C0002G0024 [Microgenomates group bacterium GW2011_GWB1_46_7]KKU61756.1 MAG: hypothetical protein UX82_C0002G0034 [Microgenomates group bacterium GW2011_GWE1_47_12]